jgi:hypothetical protein
MDLHRDRDATDGESVFAFFAAVADFLDGLLYLARFALSLTLHFVILSASDT